MAERPVQSRYARILLETATHPKFVGDRRRGWTPLSAAARGTWECALVLAEISYPNPVHEAAVELQAPGAAFDELYERNLLEPCDDAPGWFYVHDLDDFHRAPSDTAEAVAERVRRHRAKRHQAVSDPDVTGETDETGATSGNAILDQTRQRDTNRLNSPLGTRADGQSRRSSMSRPFEGVSR